MPHSPENQNGTYVKETLVLEPEVSCEGHIGRRSQSGRKIEEVDLSLRKCQSLDGSARKGTSKDVRRLKTRKLRVPEIPRKIVNIVSILQHENFLDIVDQFFKPVNKQPRKKTKPYNTSESPRGTDMSLAADLRDETV